MAEVICTKATPRTLKARVQAQKDAGRKILDVVVSKMKLKHDGEVTSNFTVTEYVVISQARD